MNPAASARLRATPAQPIRERAPKQPHGSPARPRMIALAIVSANMHIRAAPSNAASVEPATTRHRETELDRDQRPEPERRAVGLSKPESASASRPARGLASLAIAAPTRTPASTNRSPISTMGRTLLNASVSYREVYITVW